MNDHVFFMKESADVHSCNVALADRYTFKLWRPSALRIVPHGVPTVPFGAWWAMHWLHAFSNRDYSLLLIHDGKTLVHRSCVFPRYFRFPFMGKRDLQIGDTWTAKEHRGGNLAAFAAQKIFELQRKPGRRFWYVASESNRPSIRAAEKAGFAPAGKGRRVSRWGLKPLGAFVMEQKEPAPFSAKGSNMLKRLFDIVMSLLGLILFSPLLLAVALWVKLDSPGPVFYRGRRMGRGGKPFELFKFRTMVVDADRIGASSTADDDPRITRVGRFLRRLKLDELPQLLNVLGGSMSFVGPRPQVAWAVELYSVEERQLLAVRPGITDYSSLVFCNEGEILKGSKDPDKDYLEKIAPRKLRLGLEYVRRNNLWIDVKIIAATILAIAGVEPQWCLADNCREIMTQTEKQSLHQTKKAA